MTGIQALERLFLSKPPKLKQVEKIEFEYDKPFVWNFGIAPQLP
jgi:hypothetical protein